MLSDADKKHIITSWRRVVPIAETAADLFYRRLFELEPSYRKFFSADMAEQKKKLVRMFQFIVKSMDWLDEDWREDVDPADDLCLVVLAMGKRHDQLYKIPVESYDAVGQALIWALEQGLGDSFTTEVRSAWTQLYSVVSTTMKMGASAGKLPMAPRKHG